MTKARIKPSLKKKTGVKAKTKVKTKPKTEPVTKAKGKAEPTKVKAKIKPAAKSKTEDKPTVDRTRLYEPLEAVKLAQATAKNRFEGKIEVHANLKSTGKFGKYQTERKTPLLHAVLGRQSEKPELLTKELEHLIRVVGPLQIKKLIVCATMGPGIKVKILEK